MIKYQAVARKHIIGANNDDDLRALDGILFGEIYSLDSLSRDIENRLIEELLNNNPDFDYDECKVEALE